MCSEHIQGDEWGTYVALARAAPLERGMAYRARAPRSRSHRSSRRWGEPITGRRVAGRRQMNGGRVRDAQEPEPNSLSSTGELIDIERVTISSEGDRWKRAERYLAGGLPYVRRGTRCCILDTVKRSSKGDSWVIDSPEGESWRGQEHVGKAGDTGRRVRCGPARPAR